MNLKGCILNGLVSERINIFIRSEDFFIGLSYRGLRHGLLC